MNNIKYGKLENNIVVEYPKNKDGNCITMNTELYQYCLSLGQVKFIGSLEDRIYSIDDDLFIQCGVIIEQNQGVTELEVLREKVALQDGAIMELAEIISTLGGN